MAREHALVARFEEVTVRARPRMPPPCNGPNRRGRGDTASADDGSDESEQHDGQATHESILVARSCPSA